jgi:hypothetical protein
MVTQALRELSEPRKMELLEWTFDSLSKKQNGECWHFTQWVDDHWHVAAVTVRCTKGLRLICHSRGSKIRRVLRTSFHIPVDGCATLRTVALRRQIFKQIKTDH